MIVFLVLVLVAMGAMLPPIPPSIRENIKNAPNFTAKSIQNIQIDRMRNITYEFAI